jgi:hypothetical protein
LTIIQGVSIIRDYKLKDCTRKEIVTSCSNRQSSIVNRQSKIMLLVLLLVLTLGWPSASAQTPAPPATPGPSATTSDYLPEAMRLLFPSAAAPLDLNNVQPPAFPGVTSALDLVSLGTLSDLRNQSGPLQPISKTLTLRLQGGIRGRIFASPPWLQPVPDRFINPKDNGELKVAIQVRQDAAQGAGLLPAQTNWGFLRVSLNGALFDYATPLLVGPPPGVKTGDTERIFGLYRQVVTTLDRQGDLGAAIGTPEHPNAGQFILGLVVDYLGESEYNTRLGEADFANRVAETLAGKDYNGDNWIGFRQEDILLGAPGWLLGRKA